MNRCVHSVVWRTWCISAVVTRQKTFRCGFAKTAHSLSISLNRNKIWDSSRSKLSQCYETCRRLYCTSSRQQKFTVSVEGNIGSGKTTLLEYFSSSPNIEILMEPVAKWRNVRGHNALALLYEDPARWSLVLQTYVQLTLLQAHIQKQIKPVKLMERSIYSAKYCFVENLHRSGKMQDIEYIILTRWFDWIVQNEDVNVDLIIYLRTAPEVVFERIRKRCRKEEKAIPLEYLYALHELHEDWLIRKNTFPLPAPVLVIDGNCDLPEMEKIFENSKKDILCGYS